MMKEKILKIIKGLRDTAFMTALIYAWALLAAIGHKNELYEASEIFAYLGLIVLLLTLISAPRVVKHIWRIKNNQ